MNNFHNQPPLSGELKFSPYSGFYVGAEVSKLTAPQIIVLGLILAGVAFYYWQKSSQEQK